MAPDHPQPEPAATKHGSGERGREGKGPTDRDAATRGAGRKLAADWTKGKEVLTGGRGKWNDTNLRQVRLRYTPRLPVPCSPEWGDMCSVRPLRTHRSHVSHKEQGQGQQGRQGRPRRRRSVPQMWSHRPQQALVSVEKTHLRGMQQSWAHARCVQGGGGKAATANATSTCSSRGLLRSRSYRCG